MGLVKGEAADTDNPWGPIKNTRKLLRTAALIMSVMLIGSSFGGSNAHSRQRLCKGEKANRRALSF